MDFERVSVGIGEISVGSHTTMLAAHEQPAAGLPPTDAMTGSYSSRFGNM
jgi:hypothetical protein